MTRNDAAPGDLSTLLLRAERAIALLSRATPENLPAERARLTEAWSRGEALLPEFRYARVAILADPLVDLERVASLRVVADGHSPEIVRLLAERAEELLLEAELAHALGTGSFPTLARRRWDQVPEQARATALAESWLVALPAPSPANGSDAAVTILTDDASDPRSLLRQMQAAIGQLRLPLRIVVSGALAATAAAAPGVITIASGRRLPEIEAQRIVAHELYGHAVPMLNAATLRSISRTGPLLATGSRGGADTQEGWALWIEESLGLLTPERRRSLALRHLAAVATLEGANFADVMRLLLGRGARVPQAIEMALRVQRGADGKGGGFGREIVYLAFGRRVAARCEAEAVRRWFELGRLSLDAIDAFGAEALPDAPYPIRPELFRAELGDHRDVVGGLRLAALGAVHQDVPTPTRQARADEHVVDA